MRAAAEKCSGLLVNWLLFPVTEAPVPIWIPPPLPAARRVGGLPPGARRSQTCCLKGYQAALLGEPTARHFADRGLRVARLRLAEGRNAKERYDGYAGAHFSVESPVKNVGLREGPSTLDQADDNHHDRQNQKNMDEPSHGVGSGESESPEDQQNHCNCPEHVHAFLESWLARPR